MPASDIIPLLGSFRLVGAHLPFGQFLDLGFRIQWKQFEDLIAEIQRELTPAAKVQTNLKRQGRRSQSLRQIDLEMKIAQFDVSIVIDCKDYKKPVDIKEVEAFIPMIEDLSATFN